MRIVRARQTKELSLIRKFQFEEHLTVRSSNVPPIRGTRSRDENVQAMRFASLFPAALFLVAAVLWNPWSWDWLLGSCALESDAARWSLTGLSAGLLGWSLAALYLPPAPSLIRVHTVLATTLSHGSNPMNLHP